MPDRIPQKFIISTIYKYCDFKYHIKGLDRKRGLLFQPTRRVKFLSKILFLKLLIGFKEKQYIIWDRRRGHKKLKGKSQHFWIFTLKFTKNCDKYYILLQQQSHYYEFICRHDSREILEFKPWNQISFQSRYFSILKLYMGSDFITTKETLFWRFWRV